MKKITVISIGTGNEELLTMGAVRALKTAKTLVLRTGRHAVAGYLKAEGIEFGTLDELYDQCEDFDIFNQAVAVRLLEMCEKGPLSYGVADASMDATVMALHRLKPRNVEVEVLAGVSHGDRCFSMLAVQSAGLRMMAASEFSGARVTPGEPLLLCEVHSRECAGDCKLRLLDLLPPETEVTFFEGDEKGALTARTMELCEIDRQNRYDHLAAVYVPAVPMQSRTRFDMDDLQAVMARLRGPGGCPWDREQTHETLLTNLLEECYEFIAAVREEDTDHMYDELGDVLLQVVFHAEIARQHGEFALNDVTTAICQKMMERHTHIFGDAKADTAEEVLTNWEAIKRRQRGIASHAQAMRDVSTGLSSMLRAWKVQHKAAKVGFDFAGPKEALAKVREEADEVAKELATGKELEKELGDVIFSVVNVCRLCGKNPDIALFSATNKFISRFDAMENRIKMEGKCVEDLTLSEMDVYWDAEKQVE